MYSYFIQTEMGNSGSQYGDFNFSIKSLFCIRYLFSYAVFSMISSITNTINKSQNLENFFWGW
jgi:hypothetical protein